MRAILIHNRAFFPNFGDHFHLKLLQITQPSMDQLGGSAGGSRCEIVHFHQHRVHAPGRRIKQNTGPGNPAPDDKDI
ncbi:hypothetical protein D3C87_1840860 [compost metagenome]